MKTDPILFTVLRHRCEEVAESMGEILRRSAVSPNIRERLDYSCAIFDATGSLLAQAAHIPVHLGSMPRTVEHVMAEGPWVAGDIAIVNDPYQGGTHLPDITLVAPMIQDGATMFWVACRAHHADVGGMSPGSMAVTRSLLQEGVVIPVTRLRSAGAVQHDILQLLLANMRNPTERRADLQAQIAACDEGLQALQKLVAHYGYGALHTFGADQHEYTVALVRAWLSDCPDGSGTGLAEVDGPDGIVGSVSCKVHKQATDLHLDFSASSLQNQWNLNAVRSITEAAVLFVLRCLVGGNLPASAAVLDAVQLQTVPGTIVDAMFPAAVAAGNVEISQKVVAALVQALQQWLPEVPAASQATMNNVVIGQQQSPGYTYYETLAGGAGAAPGRHGVSARHTGMTNTRNTPVEVLEAVYPLRIRRYALRRASGGQGRWQGGDGIVREYEFLQPASLQLLTQDRRTGPAGAAGGDDGQPGRNTLVYKDGREAELQPCVNLDVDAGDCLRIETPGGGGYGSNPDV